MRSWRCAARARLWGEIHTLDVPNRFSYRSVQGRKPTSGCEEPDGLANLVPTVRSVRFFGQQVLTTFSGSSISLRQKLPSQ
jgi:hypothetical protein